MLRTVLAAALLLALVACSRGNATTVTLTPSTSVADQHSELSERADRGRVRPLQPPAAPDTRSPQAARPAPQRAQESAMRTVRPSMRTVRMEQAATGCTGRMSRDQAHACWDGLLAAYPWPIATAFRILYCESTGNPNAANGRYHGLMQVDDASFDPALNIAAAYGFWLRRGWQPWECK